MLMTIAFTEGQHFYRTAHRQTGEPLYYSNSVLLQLSEHRGVHLPLSWSIPSVNACRPATRGRGR